MADLPTPPPRPADLERLVATAIAEKLAESGSSADSSEALLADQSLRHRDFTGLGLNSLDWMDVATRLEDELGIELPDEFLLDAGRRSLAGWIDYLVRTVAAEPP